METPPRFYPALHRKVLCARPRCVTVDGDPLMYRTQKAFEQRLSSQAAAAAADAELEELQIVT